MRDTLLVINAGSSSLKFHLYILDSANRPQLSSGGQIGGIGTAQPRLRVRDGDGATCCDRALAPDDCRDLAAAQRHLGDWLASQLTRPPLAVGHRIVHGGPNFTDSVVINAGVLDQLDALAPLAPLHQHNNLAPVRVLMENWPEIVQVACFDTAFHRTHSPVVDRYALPERYYHEGIRRYGFHGISYEYIAERLRQTRPALARGRVVVAHLGSGASACALLDGVSVETTMGFTALDGLPMATRPGSLDAGVVLWMLSQGMHHDEIQQLLYTQSGLLGLSGVSGDIRELLASAEPAARLALDLFAYRSAEKIAGLCVALGGIDALIFTAGIGEHRPTVRAAICEQLAWLGMTLDPDHNAAGIGCISREDSRITVLVEPTNEEWMIARKTAALLVRR